MKPMTEQEARAALKAEMPWARVAAWENIGVVTPAEVELWRGPILIRAEAPTLRAAVAKAIKAWRNTQKKGRK